MPPRVLLCYLPALPTLGTVFAALSTTSKCTYFKSFPIFLGSYLFKALTPPFFAGAARIILQTALGGALVALPLAAFQYYGYRQFCTAGALSEAPAWCADPLPYLYGHVQRQYWGVGFLRYFRLQQVRRTLRSGRRWALDCTDVSLACA